jgi:hypothetical protein
LLAQLRELDYVMFRLLADTTALRLADIEPHDDLRLTNYLFVPAEDAPLIADIGSAKPNAIPGGD